MRKLMVAMMSVVGLALAGCGAGGGSSATGGHVKLLLTDAPLDGAIAVNVTITSVQILSAADTAATPDGGEAAESGRIEILGAPRTVNLLELRNGASTLLGEADVPGPIGQIRLMMDGNVTVVLADGTERQARVPSGAQTGIKIVGNIDPTGEILLDFDAGKSIHETGNGELIMRPTIKAMVGGNVQGETDPTDDTSAEPDAGMPTPPEMQ